MWKVLASLILRNRLFVLTIIALLTVFFGYYAVTSLKVDNRYGNTLPKDSPAQADYLKFKTQFGEDGSTLVIAVKADSLYTEKNLSFRKRRITHPPLSGPTTGKTVATGGTSTKVCAIDDLLIYLPFS